VIRGTKIDHAVGEHDDFSNCLAGLIERTNIKGVTPRIAFVSKGPASQEFAARPVCKEGETVIPIWEQDRIVGYEKIYRPRRGIYLPGFR
jgi:hypothetical protein